MVQIRPAKDNCPFKISSQKEAKMKGLHVLTVLFFVAFTTGIFAQTVPTAAVSEFQSQYIVDIRPEVHDHDNGRMLFDDYTGNLVGNQYVLTVASSLLVEEGAQT